jgi:L-seryl-tRNA(Ser) seleniumtransferase
VTDAGAAADPRRVLPSVDRLLAHPAAQAVVARWGREPVVAALRAELEELRRAIGEHGEDVAATSDDAGIVERAAAHLHRELAPGLHPVLNGTGVVLHTNLGRAPLSEDAMRALGAVAAGYANLEYDLAEGRRGDRYDHCAALLRRVTGAEDAIVVNNNAAAVVLGVNEFARGRDVLVSRGELVEIGGSFRIPEMIERAGARLVAVGATNRTRLSDYRDALSPETGLILKVHPANFRIQGFTESVTVGELAPLARDAGVPLMWDLGSAAPAGVLPERLAGPSPSGADARAADVVTWSGDKLLGGPQAGIVHGHAAAIGRLRKNPLLRAFRVDKLTLAALEATLRAWLDPSVAAARLPAVRRLLEPSASVRERALEARERLPAAVRHRVEIVELSALVGAGSAPEQEIESAGWAVAGSASGLDAACRAARPPLVGRVEDGRFLVDFRCLEGDDAAEAARIVGDALESLRTSDAAEGT